MGRDKLAALKHVLHKKGVYLGFGAAGFTNCISTRKGNMGGGGACLLK